MNRNSLGKYNTIVVKIESFMMSYDDENPPSWIIIYINVAAILNFYDNRKLSYFANIGKKTVGMNLNM